MPSNIDSVIDDVEDVGDELQSQLRRKVGVGVERMGGDVRANISDDPLFKGNLYGSVRVQSPIGGGKRMQWSVIVGGSKAPHAGVVEFGSGKKSDVTFINSNPIPIRWYQSETAQYPSEYQYDAPDIDKGFLASKIRRWMAVKGIPPKMDTLSASASAIASEIIENGTYAHPYLRPAFYQNELKILQNARNAVRRSTR